MSERADLTPVDSVDVTILVDNYSDILLPSTASVQRPTLVWNWSEREQLRAEHGFSLLITVRRDGHSSSILYDAGLGRDTVMHNIDVLAIKPAELRAMVLSHGHADHHGGLEGIVQRIGKKGRRGLPLVLHPDVWRDRKIVFPTGVEMHMPPPSHNDLQHEGVAIIEERGPTLLVDNTLLITGQVDRVTDFEKGFPLQQARTKHGWEPDIWVWDDQAVVCHVKDKGLVVLSACSHAGVVNVLLHARRLTGVNQVYALVGGMHLSGAVMEPLIPQTIAKVAELAPSVLVPAHCTGWKAIHELARQLPDAFVHSSVGTRLHFD